MFSKRLLLVLCLTLLAAIVLLVQGKPIEVTLGHKCSDCVSSLEELPAVVEGSEDVTVRILEGEYRVPPGLTLSNSLISFQPWGSDFAVFAFYLNESGSFHFDAPGGRVTFTAVKFKDSGEEQPLAPLTLIQTKQTQLNLFSCRFNFQNARFMIDVMGPHFNLAGGSNLGEIPSQAAPSIILRSPKAEASIVNVYIPSGLQLTLPDNSKLTVVGNQIHGDLILQRVSENTLPTNLFIYGNYWAEGALRMLEGAFSGNLTFRANWMTKPPIMFNLTYFSQWNIQGNNFLFHEAFESIWVTPKNFRQLAPNYWSDPTQQIPEGIIPNRQNIMAARLGGSMQQLIVPDGSPEVAFTDFSTIFRNGTLHCSHVGGLAIYDERVQPYSQPIPSLMLERKACVVPHELFLAEPPPINANPTLIVTYDLSKRADCKGLLGNASKPTLWYLPLDTMTGDPSDQWRGVPQTLLNWNTSSSQLNFTLSQNTADWAYSLTSSAMQTGLPLALFLSPLLGFAQPELLVDLPLHAPAPFVFKVPLTLFPATSSETALQLSINVTVEGAVIGQDISILSGNGIYLQGNQANITIALFASFMKQVKASSKLVMTVNVEDWNNELIPLSKAHTRCLVSIVTRSPAIDPPGAPTASVFPDNTPNLQLVPKMQDEMQLQQRVGFQFHSITERNQEGETVRTLAFPAAGYEASFPDNNTAEFRVALGTENEVEVHWKFNVVEEDTEFTFGSQSFTVLAGFNKWSMTILGWPHQQQSSFLQEELSDGASQPFLPLEVKVNVTSWDGPLNFTQATRPVIRAEEKEKESETNRNSTSFKTNNTRLVVGLLHMSLVDGEECLGSARFEAMSGEEGGLWLYIQVPVGKKVEFDPDVQVLIDSSKDKDGDWNMKMIIVVSVCVGTAVCVVASAIVGVVVWQRRKNARFKASFGAVNFTDEEYTMSSSAEYSLLVDSDT